MASITNYGYGDGSDGSYSVVANINMSDLITGGRSYADMISYNVSALSSSYADVDSANANGIVAGDKVLLIAVQGTRADYDNIGNWEILDVLSVVGNRVTFTGVKTNFYGSVGGDTNIGTAVSNYRVILQRIPQYQNFTITSGNSITVDRWLGTKDGIICMMINGTMTITGDINMSGLGFRSTPGKRYWSGESYNWWPNTDPDSYGDRNLGGGAGTNGYGTGGAGGGYGTAGTDAWSNHTVTLQGGLAYGSSDLAKIYFGSGAGGGYGTEYAGAEAAYTVGMGGGNLMLFAHTIQGAGSILNNGVNGGYDNNGGTGGGAGGSVLIWGGTVGDINMSATGGAGVTAGTGGVGRLAVYYKNLTGTISATPSAFTELSASWKVGGTLSEAARVAVYDVSSDQLLKAEDKSAGAYEIVGLDVSTAVNVVAYKSSGELIGFGNVIPAEE